MALAIEKVGGTRDKAQQSHRMKPYSDYKDSGFEWLGSIPAHWGLGKLGACFDERNEKVSDEDFAPLSVTKNGIVPQMEHVAKTDAGDNRKKVCINDFVINSRSDRKGASGISAYEGSVSLISIVLKPREHHPAFVHHLLRSYNFQEEFYRFGKGIVADLWSTRYAEMKGISIPLLPIAEQISIANFLDRETARIDNLIAEKQNFINLLKEKRQALISHVVTKGLDPKAKMKESGIEWIGEVPEHWEVKSYRYACKIYRGKFGHRPRNDPTLYDGEYPFIQTGDIARARKTIESYKQTLNENGIKVSQKFPAGTLVMAIAANIGVTAILGFEAYAPDSVVGFAPYAGIDLEFLQFSFNAALPALEQTSTQSTQANLNIERVAALKGVFPPHDEQVEIVDFLEKESARIDKLLDEVGVSIELLNEHRTALISAAVTGKIDVRVQQ